MTIAGNLLLTFNNGQMDGCWCSLAPAFKTAGMPHQEPTGHEDKRVEGEVRKREALAVFLGEGLFHPRF